MTKKYEKQCWICGSRDMENKGPFVQCRACGATWNYVSSLGMSPVTEVDAQTGKSSRAGRPTEFKPRGGIR